MTPEWRARVSAHAVGKTIASLTWEDAHGGYWVMTFTDGSEICWQRTMAEAQAERPGGRGG